MSTRIGDIEGRYESQFTDEHRSDTCLSLTRFYGGNELGTMLQLTIENEDGYIQFTEEQAKELARIILNSFDENIYPSE